MANLAVKNPTTNYIAIDVVDAMLGLAKRNIEEKYKEENKEINNVILTRFDIERILLMLNEMIRLIEYILIFVIHGQEENIEKSD